MLVALKREGGLEAVEYASGWRVVVRVEEGAGPVVAHQAIAKQLGASYGASILRAVHMSI